jgi:hypothetical protein
MPNDCEIPYVGVWFSREHDGIAPFRRTRGSLFKINIVAQPEKQSDPDRVCYHLNMAASKPVRK